MSDSVLRENSEDAFRIKTKELDSTIINHLTQVKMKAQDLRDEILKAGSNETVSKALDKLNEAIFWVTYARSA
jgi:hypothetical protein